MTFHVRNIVGSGGGGGKGGGGGGNEAQNTLRSKARARLVELLGEGPIAGLVDGYRSIYFDQTPVMNENGSLNFEGVNYEERRGYPDQPHLGIAPMAETPFSVEARVKYNQLPPQRTIVERNADAVRVIVRIPTLVRQDKETGDINPASVSYAIDLRNYGGQWVEQRRVDIVNEKCTSAYERADVIYLDPSGYPWDIRVRRITEDSEVVELQNETYWASYYVLVNGKFTYPHSAVVAIDADSEQFGQSSLPTRYFDVKGLIISVPNVYDPINRTYSGVWNGAFKQAWTNNPAWILYDLLSNDRYGLGEFIDASKIDKWSLFEIGRYCDQMVPNGYGGMEPRYTFNGVINSREEAFKVLQTVTTAFRGMAFWSLGQVFASADMPSDVIKLVSPANIIDGQFTYSGTAIKARHSVALVTWNDPTDFYRPAIEVVIDDEMLQKYGWRETEIQAVGCTSRGMAHRYGKWVLDTEKNATETVTYEASWDHADIRPGNIIAIADPNKAQVRTGGRIVDVAGAIVTLDGPFALTPNETYQMMVEAPDGSIQTRQILSANDRTVTLIAPFAQTPQKNAMWVITGTDVKPRQYRVLSINETDKHLFKITALFHDPTKYQRIENNVALATVPYSRPRTHINPPTNPQAVESTYFNNGVARSRVSLSWTSSDDFMAAGYMVSANSPSGYVSYGQVARTSIDIDDPRVGDWVFYISSVGKGGITSQPVSLSFTVKGWEGLSQPFVSHLEIYGRGTATDFGGRDCRVTWRNNFPGTTYTVGSEPSAGASLSNPFYRDNVVRVFDPDTNDLLRIESIITNDYTYTFERNVEDNAKFDRGPLRRFRIEVTVRDNLGRESNPKAITVENEVPDLIIPTVTSGLEQIFVDYAAPDDLDFKGVLVWVSDEMTFDPLAVDPVYDGPNTFISLPAEKFTVRYVRIAGYDAFGRSGLNISPPIEVAVGGVEVDKDPPAVPTNLTLQTLIETMPTGETQNRLIATWDDQDAAETNFSYFEVEIGLVDGPYLAYPTATGRYEWTGLIPSVAYRVRVRSVSKNGYSSNFSDVAEITMPSKTTGPAAPSNLQAVASLRSVFLSWTNPVDADLSEIEIWSGTTNNRNSAVLIGASRTDAFTHAGLTTGQQRFYWIRARNTSGIASAFDRGVTAGLAITPGEVAEGDIAANAITAEKIRANEITGDKIKVDTAFPASISIGSTGITMGELTDPADLINGGSTLIDPGRIVISGGTTLASWRDGTDQTKISGGAIQANTIDANKVTVGLRGLSFIGLQFSYNKTTNQLSWSAGAVTYINDAGNNQTDNVSAGNATWTTGTLYVAWRRGQSALEVSTTPFAQPTHVILATYRGGNDLVANYGRTIIDGANIVTGTITANAIAAGTITGDKIAANSLTATNIQAASITFDKMRGGTISVAEAIRIGGDRFRIQADQQRIIIKDGQSFNDGSGVAGRTRLIIGKTGDNETDYGFSAFDATGALIFSTGGWGSAVIPGDAIQAISADQVTELGALALANYVQFGTSDVQGFGEFAGLSQITSSNASTFIANAAIQNAQIGNLSGDKILANTIGADRIVANSITARELSTGQLITASAQIANAVITTAKIQDLSVNTIKIANGAISNAGSAEANDNTVTAYVYARANAKISAIITAEGYQRLAGSGLDRDLTIYFNGNSVGTIRLRPITSYSEDGGGTVTITHDYPSVTKQLIFSNFAEQTVSVAVQGSTSIRISVTLIELAK